MIQLADIPPGALLASYCQAGDFTDCRAVDVPGEVNLAEFVTAFYDSWAFRPERWLLGVLLGRGAGSDDVTALAAGSIERFAAWSVEARAPDQLLLCDYKGKTRSWLMVQPQPNGTRLYFGSAVVTTRSRTDRLAFQALLWFHAAYSRVLLFAAARATST